uniref:Uncharacterized protein n=1 Tax=Arion vulgaris TaxID=1028688 RepID=A0A0B7ALI6_9EUPU
MLNSTGGNPRHICALSDVHVPNRSTNDLVKKDNIGEMITFIHPWDIPSSKSRVGSRDKYQIDGTILCPQF